MVSALSCLGGSNKGNKPQNVQGLPGDSLVLSGIVLKFDQMKSVNMSVRQDQMIQLLNNCLNDEMLSNFDILFLKCKLINLTHQSDQLTSGMKSQKRQPCYLISNSQRSQAPLSKFVNDSMHFASNLVFLLAKIKNLTFRQTMQKIYHALIKVQKDKLIWYTITTFLWLAINS